MVKGHSALARWSRSHPRNHCLESHGPRSDLYTSSQAPSISLASVVNSTLTCKSWGCRPDLRGALHSKSTLCTDGNSR